MFVSLFCRKKPITSCPKCGEEISLDDCFKDKAVENELKTATIKCINQDCPWEGSGQYYKVAEYCDVVGLKWMFRCYIIYNIIDFVLSVQGTFLESQGAL